MINTALLSIIFRILKKSVRSLVENKIKLLFFLQVEQKFLNFIADVTIKEKISKERALIFVIQLVYCPFPYSLSI